MRIHKSSRPAVGAFLVIASVLGVSTYASSATSAPDEEVAPSLVRPAPGTVQVSSSVKFDGREWAVRQFKTDAGEICLQFGELQNGQVGRVGPEGFASQPLDQGGVCGSPAGPFLAINRDRDNPATPQVERPKTAIFGVLPADAVDAHVEFNGTRTVVDVGANQVFVTLVDGTAATRDPVVSWSADGRKQQVGGGRTVLSDGARK